MRLKIDGGLGLKAIQARSRTKNALAPVAGASAAAEVPRVVGVAAGVVDVAAVEAIAAGAGAAAIAIVAEAAAGAAATAGAAVAAAATAGAEAAATAGAGALALTVIDVAIGHRHEALGDCPSQRYRLSTLYAVAWYAICRSMGLSLNCLCAGETVCAIGPSLANNVGYPCPSYCRLASMRG